MFEPSMSRDLGLISSLGRETERDRNIDNMGAYVCTCKLLVISSGVIF